MKNSIHDFYAHEHQSDPQISFEESIGKQKSFIKSMSPYAAIAATVIAGIFLMPLIENGETAINRDDDVAEPSRVQFAASQPAENAEQEGRSAPTNPNSGIERILPIATVSPSYPTEAELQNIEGWVLISLTVSAEGEVLDPYVEDAEPPDIFNESALEAIRQFTFRPQMVDDQPVEVSGVQYLFRYNLDDSE